ncbi:MAG TPA: PaaI family thioesterase [Candidatus Acidoferrales bacterium]|nr:PaaI family thioesterase [Candidatus Acidoferrales bacterium]
MSAAQETVQKIISGEAPSPPVARLIGFHLVSAAEGAALFEMDADERHWNPMGTVHGGVLCDIADAAMGFAYATKLEEGESFTTVELKINYLRPVWKARLRASARIVKKGRKMGLVECDVTDEKGNLVARASSTCMTLSGDDARTR